MLKLGRGADGAKMTPEAAASVSLEEVKKMIEDQVPGAFTKKMKAPSKAAAKKAPAKRAAPKKGGKKKA
jgi:DNA topoisomerase-1